MFKPNRLMQSWSRNDPLMIAVGFNPQSCSSQTALVAERRLKLGQFCFHLKCRFKSLP